MKVLVACEFSGVVRDAFVALGHRAESCDLLPTERPNWTLDVFGIRRIHHPERGYHWRRDVREILADGWDLMIAHPPCTYLSVSGLHWNGRVPGRATKTEEAAAFFMDLANAPIKCVAIENPISCVSRRWRKPDQIIQPHQFGHDASKATCLWLRNLPKLTPTQNVAPRLVDGRPRWANQTDSGQNRLGPSDTRAMERSKTYQGIADAMAAQWGALG